MVSQTVSDPMRSSASWRTVLVPALLAMLLLLTACSTTPELPAGETVRIALFNVWELSTEKLNEVDDHGIGQDEQLVAAAEIIQRIRPDVLVLQEIDHDYDAVARGEDLSLTARQFIERYLDQGEDAYTFAHVFAAPCNTGILAGEDFDNDGHIATSSDLHTRTYGGDCFGYGEYPGQYSMAVLSNLPLDTAQVRTFQQFLWRDLPDNLIPPRWYTIPEIQKFRLSSKSHWDIPILIDGDPIHLLVSHPTPPVFDGPEDRNGRRNYDELRMWVHYLDNDDVLVDDQGVRGGLPETTSFVLAGDLNAGPTGDTLSTGQRAIDQLLTHPRIHDCGEFLTSTGALRGRPAGPPNHFERNTTGFGDHGMRIDHLMPSTDLEIVDGGVFWPDSTADADGAALAETASDHRLIWLDIKLK